MADEEWADPETEDMEEDSTDYIEAIDSTAPDDSDELPSDEDEDDEDTIIDAEADDTIPDEVDDAGDASGTAEDVEAIGETEPDEDAELPTDEDEADESEDLDETLPANDPDEPSAINDNQATLPCICSVKQGDTVMVAMRNGEPTVIGRAGWGDAIETSIESAAAIAAQAQGVANATNQHFFSDSSGVHVTEAEGDATTDHNILINSFGILLRKASTYLVSITESAVAFFDGLGTTASNVVAQFGASGATIGKTSEVHTVIDSNGMSTYNSDGSLATINTVNLVETRDAASQALRDAASAATAATNAQTSADSAASAASAAQSSANAAATAASAAQATANSAASAASAAQASANAAQTSANNAQDSADAASDALQSVVSGATTVERAVSVMQTALEAIVDYDADNDTTTEYFWHDANGAHVLGDTSGYRNDTDSTGMSIVDTSDEESVARFGADGAQIGKDGESHLDMDYHSMQLLDKDGDAYFKVNDARNENGLAYIEEKFIGDGTTQEFTSNYLMSRYPRVFIDGVESSDFRTENVYIETGLKTRLLFTNITPPDQSVIVAKFYTTDPAYAFTYGTRSTTSATGVYSAVLGIGNAASNIASTAIGRYSQASGEYSYAEGYGTKASGDYSHANGYRTTASGAYSHGEGEETTASGSTSHAEGHQTTASGAASHAEGQLTEANGNFAHAEGSHTTASSDYAHAEGYYTEAGWKAHAEGESTVASGYRSHSEGDQTTASGHDSHAEGGNTTASGYASHAEGGGAVASGAYSHAQNRGTVATSDNQTALGKYNVSDANDTYAVIVGNGTSDSARSNALTVDWDGDVETAGSATIKTPNINRDGALPSTDQFSNGRFRVADVDGDAIGAIDSYRLATGESGIRLIGYAGPSGASVYNTFRVGKLADGTNVYYVTDPPAFREAINAVGWDMYKSTTVSQVITAASGITVSSVTYAEWGKVAMLSASCSGFAASTGTQTVGTVASGKRPVYNVYATDVSSAYATYALLTMAGALTVYWGTAPSTSTSYTIRFIYILA